jgi:primosomal protein N' (replication factor Y)
MYADVILPLPLSGLFTYAIPAEMQHKIGRGFRVTVPFGRRKYYTAIVTKIHRQSPENFTVKEIQSLLDSTPVVTEQQLELWEWISFYYLSAQGDVFKAALPSPMMPADLQPASSRKVKHIYGSILHWMILLLAHPLERRANSSYCWTKLCGFSPKPVGKYQQERGKELTGYSPAVLNGLLRKEILHLFSVGRSRLHPKTAPTRTPYPLSEEQQKALDTIQSSFSDKQTVLLHGATSSGKQKSISILSINFLPKANRYFTSCRKSP